MIMNFRIIFYIIILGFSSLPIWGEKVLFEANPEMDMKSAEDYGMVEVSGEGTYYLEGSDNVDYARSMAVQIAKANAIASAFGTAVTSSAHQEMSWTSEGDERNSFSMVMRTLRKGIWVKDTEAPEIESFLNEDSSFGFKAKVKGLVRPLRSNPIGTRGRVLVGDTGGKNTPHEAESLKVGEEFFFSFKAATDGYLAIYLADENGLVYRAAPVSGADKRLIRVQGEECIIVKDEYVKNIADISETGISEVVNRVVYIFSPNEFTQPLTSDSYVTDSSGASIDYDRFHEWLQDSAVADPKFTVSWQTIRIHK